jgi:hypothetical protein
MREFLARLVNEADGSDVAVLLGGILLTVGAAQAFAPAGYMVPGALLLWLGMRD